MNKLSKEEILQKIDLFTIEFESWLDNKLTNNHSQNDVYSKACAMSNKLFYDNMVLDFPYVHALIMDNILDVSIEFETGYENKVVRFRKNMAEVAALRNEVITIYGSKYKLVKV